MKASKFILLLAGEYSPLAKFTDTLQEQDFDVSMALNAEVALGVASALEQLSLVAVDASTSGVTPELLARLKEENGDMPVVWILPKGAEAPDFGMLEPSAVLNFPLTQERFTDLARELLHDNFYPQSLMQSLMASSNAVMATTFQLSTDVDTPWLKFSGRVPGEVNAFLPFMGDNALGHLMVSGSVEYLVQLGIELGFEEDEGHKRIAREVISEVANQIVGRLKLDCKSYLGDIRLGLPLVFGGSKMHLSYPASKPSLCVKVGDSRGELHIEFSFQVANIEHEETVFLQPGVVVLF